MPCSLYKKLFLSPYYFTIALKRRGLEHPPKSTVFKCEFAMPAKPEKWYADPMLIDCNDKTYMFYEAVVNGKGHLEVVTVNDDCSVSEPTVILRDDCHYSYPFVFSYDNEWYMIPESSAASEVRLYKAAEFPYRWEMCDVIMHERAVDTTVFESNQGLIMLTYIIDPNGTERVTPQAFTLDITNGKTALKKLDWQNFDCLKVRGAGGFFTDSGNVYRPAQLSSDHKYGNGVAFYEADLGNGRYSETPVAQMLPDSVIYSGSYFDGLHTYSRSEHVEAIDVRCRKFDLFKVIKALLSRKR